MPSVHSIRQTPRRRNPCSPRRSTLRRDPLPRLREQNRAVNQLVSCCSYISFRYACCPTRLPPSYQEPPHSLQTAADPAPAVLPFPIHKVRTAHELCPGSPAKLQEAVCLRL